MYQLWMIAGLAVGFACYTSGVLHDALSASWMVALILAVLVWGAVRGYFNRASVRNAANICVLLGLIGTVWGFIVALSGVEPSKAGDVSAITPMVSQLIKGMGIALYTTLAGTVSALWCAVAYRVPHV